MQEVSIHSSEQVGIPGAGGEGERYDYIICGAGCAGLSLAVHLIRSGKLADKKVLIVDKDAKKTNDRTWCFWEEEQGPFEPVVYKKWDRLMFHSTRFSKELHITPYTYKLIRGIDFYQYSIDLIRRQPNMRLLQAGVEEVFSEEEGAGVVIDGRRYRGAFVFNSILGTPPALHKSQYWLLQHFKGWVIETESPEFDAAAATLMDFRTDQGQGTTFFYVLPFSATEALVEYTLFSEKLLDDGFYESALKGYVETQLGIRNYRVKEREFGVIPMTNYPFPAHRRNIVPIGTAGGQTKGSSGYTFRFIQKHSEALVQSLLAHGHPFAVAKDSGRFRFYDSVLLHILQHDKLEGRAIFTRMFQRNKAGQILKFLDNETRLGEDIRILSTLPIAHFTRAAASHLATAYGF